MIANVMFLHPAVNPSIPAVNATMVHKIILWIGIRSVLSDAVNVRLSNLAVHHVSHV
jgi:hypothetical protein